ncbi:N-acetyltransferase [Candidatus Bipolaricaulota bacterium]|nr:N-acetyltransferase [Candidatus Bipolaricaulota bacterium]
MAAITIEQIPLGDRRLRKFVAVPWHIHHGDPHWTPPLTADLLGSRLLGLTGLLTPTHPYHRMADVTHFLARKGPRLVGRVSAAVNHRFNEYHKANLGFFGFYESVPDYTVTERLLDSARGWLAKRGVDAMRGPGGYSNATHESHQAVLVHGFDTPPTVELTHNPPYYGEYLERYGLRKVKDYHAYWLAPSQPQDPRLERLVAAARSRRGIETRSLDMRRLKEEVDKLVFVYNEAWAANWGFLPITPEEADALARSLKTIADPDLIRFAYVEGELAAMIGAIPDPNVALRPTWNPLLDLDLVRVARLLAQRRRIRTGRIMFFGIRPPYRKIGVDAVLFHEVLTIAWGKGYRAGEGSMLLEDNDLILRACEAMGGYLYKTWRIYEMPIS